MEAKHLQNFLNIPRIDDVLSMNK